MPFSKKSSRPAARGAAPGGAGKQKLNTSKGNHWDSGWQQAEPDQGLPGTCGYFKGVKDGPHPSRFVYKRPDGRDDDGPAEVDPDAPMMPSRRPVPKGFFS